MTYATFPTADIAKAAADALGQHPVADRAVIERLRNLTRLADAALEYGGDTMAIGPDDWSLINNAFRALPARG